VKQAFYKKKIADAKTQHPLIKSIMPCKAHNQSESDGKDNLIRSTKIPRSMVTDSVYGRLRPCFGKLWYIDRRSFAVSYHPVHYHRIYP
jgi:hypothetical protein